MNIISGLTSRKLSKYSALKHFITKRFSENADELYLSIKVSKHRKNTINYRKKLADELGITHDKLFFPDQCHTNNVLIVDNITKDNNLKETDALITGEKNICLSVLAADCVPVLLYDPENRIIAAIHAGWRGTVRKIVQKAIIKMKEQYSCDPGNIISYIAPSICKRCYQVGREVIQEFRKQEFPDSIFDCFTDNGRANLNLWYANSLQLLNNGIKKENIEIAGECTYENPEIFFSARRDGYQTGRFATGIMMV